MFVREVWVPLLLLVFSQQQNDVRSFAVEISSKMTMPSSPTDVRPVSRMTATSKHELLLLPRKIRNCKSNITACLELLDGVPKYNKETSDSIDTPTVLQPIYLEALEVLYHHCKQTSQQVNHLAFQFYQECPTESVRAKAISVYGGHEFNATLWFHDPPGTASINAALAALARAQQWEQSQALLRQFRDIDLSTFSYNIVLMGMERTNQGAAALELLQNMDKDGPTPDQASYHHTMGALGRNHSNDKAYMLLDSMRSNGIVPNNATFDILARAYGRTGDWAMVGLVDNLRHANHLSEPFPDPMIYRERVDPSQQRHSWHWESNGQGMKQVGSGRDTWWEFATFGNLTVALQPHRNPTKNGMKILFLQHDEINDRTQPRKVGFLLMINSREDTSSQILGIFIHPDFRRLGLSKAILGVWLDLCECAGLSAKTGVINKPLLALILQHSFGFTPLDQSNVGVQVEVLPGIDGYVELYSPSTKSLEGVFRANELERQNIRILVCPPSTRGRLCQMKTAFALDKHATNEGKHRKYIEGKLKYRSCDTPWGTVLLGTNITTKM